MKKTRHNLIMQILNSEVIQTQEALAEALQKRGMVVTQATVSRDIKELNLVKTTVGQGTHAYVSMSQHENGIVDRMVRLFREAVMSMDSAGNIIVVKTISGSANAAAEAVDNMQDADILGTVAGDNTIIIVLRSNDSVQRILHQFRQWMAYP